MDVLARLADEFFQPRVNAVLQNPSPILGAEDDMVLVGVRDVVV